MDEALQAPRGIRLRHINGVPLTISSAEARRNAMGKIRKSDKAQARNAPDADPSDPTYGMSAYDALTFLIYPDLEGLTITTTWEWADTSHPWRTWLNTSVSRLPPVARTLATACTIKVEGEAGTGPGSPIPISWAISAPSFSEAWKAIQPRLPAIMDILNTYDLGEGEDFEVLE